MFRRSIYEREQSPRQTFDFMKRNDRVQPFDKTNAFGLLNFVNCWYGEFHFYFGDSSPTFFQLRIKSMTLEF